MNYSGYLSQNKDIILKSLSLGLVVYFLSLSKMLESGSIMERPMPVIFTVTNFKSCAVRPSLPYVGMRQLGMGHTTGLNTAQLGMVDILILLRQFESVQPSFLHIVTVELNIFFAKLGMVDAYYVWQRLKGVQTTFLSYAWMGNHLRPQGTRVLKVTRHVNCFKDNKGQAF